MSGYIRISTDWWDDHVSQIRIEVSDGSARFVNTTYVSPNWLHETAQSLKTFREQAADSMFDWEAGAAGPEFAGGAFVARMHFHESTGPLISTWQESAYFSYNGHTVASEARMFLRSEIVLLDRFISELFAMSLNQSLISTLECIGLTDK